MNIDQQATTSRRAFLHTVTLTTAGLALGRWSNSHAKAADPEVPLYRFPLLGDIHYDHMSHHDLEWVRREKPGDERQMLNYSKVTETLTPKLFDRVRTLIETSKGSVPFIVQVGDLVEGLCGSRDLQVRQFNETFAAIDKAAFGVPFLITKGNHDITGPGAREAYDDTLMPWLAKQSRQELAENKLANYVRRQDDDLIVFFDCYKPDLGWLDAVLTKHKARHVFFVVHQPVVPYNARANWTVFAKDGEVESRNRLIALLGQHRAIVLSGHLHKYSLLTRTTNAGSITQLAVSSVLRSENEAAKALLSGRDKYGPALTETEPDFNTKTLDRRRAILTEEQPSIRSFEYADVPGFAMINVYKDRVEADLYASLNDAQWMEPKRIGPADTIGNG